MKQDVPVKKTQIQDVVVKPLKVIADERGYLMEMLRADDPFFQSFGQCTARSPIPAWSRAGTITRCSGTTS
jgi:dTDP-4-dehydrorhamnose 3,5-epimerase